MPLHYMFPTHYPCYIAHIIDIGVQLTVIDTNGLLLQLIDRTNFPFHLYVLKIFQTTVGFNKVCLLDAINASKLNVA